MTRLPVLLLAALPLAPTLQGRTDDPCDSSLARRATANGSGYAPRDGGKGDPRCEGTFTIPVSFRPPEMEVISCVALWRDPIGEQDVVELCWESQPTPVRICAQGRSDQERYQMDALGRDTSESEHEHGHFVWDQAVLRQCELDLPRVGIIAWTREPELRPEGRQPGRSAREILQPLVVNGPFEVSLETIEALAGRVRVTLLVRCSEETVDYDFDGYWSTPESQAEAVVEEVAAFRLIRVEGMLPARGEVWTLHLFATSEDDEASLPGIHVMAPTWDFLRWAMGDEDPEEEK